MGPGEGRQAAGEDSDAADPVHPAGPVRGHPRPGGDEHQQEPLRASVAMALPATVEAPVGGRFPGLILALRWATVSTGALLSLVELRGAAGPMAATSLLCLYAAFRMLRPLPRPEGTDTPVASIAVDLGVALIGVALSGGWGSPFIFVVL